MSGEHQFFENRDLLTAENLASRLGVSRKTVYGWIYRKLIPSVKIGPKLVRFNPKEIERWILQKQENFNRVNS